MLPEEVKRSMDNRIKEAVTKTGDPDIYRTGPPWGNYDPIYNCILALVLRWDKHNSVIDLGCHLGDFTARLHEVGFKKIIGVDISPVAIQYAKKRHPEVTFIASDTLKLKFKEEFDLVVASGVLNFRYLSTEDFRRTAAKIHGFLRKGGYFIEQSSIHDYFGKEKIALKELARYFNLVINLNYTIHQKYAAPSRRAHMKDRRIRLYKKK